MAEVIHAEHNIEPVWNCESEILILGSFPSVKSREEAFFYAHPRNRFWLVTAAVFGEEAPVGTDGKKAFLLRNKIALWDVIKSCDITGSSDSSIKNVTANDIERIIKNSNVSRIFTNGAAAYRLYNRYIYPVIGIKAWPLPSTSPANAKMTVGQLTREWKQIRQEGLLYD